MENRAIGVCYYPEHWPEARWKDDAVRMVELGIQQVRIAEFAWSRLEPSPGRFTWGWLDRAIGTLAEAGLSITLCTPTATPPKWLVDAHPDILARDRSGRVRGFGSRRHYCFSSQTYRAQSQRITTEMARRYGAHPAVTAWQTDNEYGCHDTTRSYSDAARDAFQGWLSRRYASVEALNAAWGNVFWSIEYSDFAAVELPNLTVTEPNPSHVLDFYRFSSDQVISFNREQVGIIRQHAPGRDVLHNFMGYVFDFDHFALSEDLDAASWDSYPLGFTDVFPFFTAEEKHRYRQQGHPDVSAFHHDLYRACGRGRWWVMEQQPGPVNWAFHNPAPLPGMVRFWAHEAFAHGAEVVSFFRFRQAPFAQEQMHAGLNRPDGAIAPGGHEAKAVAGEIVGQTARPPRSAGEVALVFSYDAAWVFEAQPQGRTWDYRALVMDWYGALRRLGLNVDIVPPDGDMSAYRLVVVPSCPTGLDPERFRRGSGEGEVVFGPRTGSKTDTLTIPEGLAPGRLQDLIPLKVVAVESLPDSATFRVSGHGALSGLEGRAGRWVEHVETGLEPLLTSEDGRGLVFADGACTYLATWPDREVLFAILAQAAQRAGLATLDLGPDLRLRRDGERVVLFNHAPERVAIPEPVRTAFRFKEADIPPAGFVEARTASS